MCSRSAYDKYILRDEFGYNFSEVKCTSKSRFIIVEDNIIENRNYSYGWDHDKFFIFSRSGLKPNAYSIVEVLGVYY